MRPAGWTTIERWWNGHWGRASQRRIWVHTNGYVWRVEARQGDGDAREWSRDFTSEHEARDYAQVMRERSGDEWKDLS